jgi:hypothetical protein
MKFVVMIRRCHFPVTEMVKMIVVNEIDEGLPCIFCFFIRQQCRFGGHSKGFMIVSISFLFIIKTYSKVPSVTGSNKIDVSYSSRFVPSRAILPLPRSSLGYIGSYGTENGPAQRSDGGDHWLYPRLTRHPRIISYGSHN